MKDANVLEMKAEEMDKVMAKMKKTHLGEDSKASTIC